MAEQPAQQVQIQINIDEEVAQGVYANLALITSSEAEFTLDFVYLQPQAPKAKVRARVITSPQHAKRLALVLQENIARYEAQHGPIAVAPVPSGLGPRH
jgi:hypothetical protein